MTRHRTETFFDGAYWQAECPEPWSFRRDTTVEGFPHVFECPPGCRLQLGTRRDVRINYGAGLTRPGIGSEPLRIAYVMTLQAAQMDGDTPARWLWAIVRGMRRFDSKLRSHDFADLSGFTYPRRDGGWAGYFAGRESWMIYALYTQAGSDPVSKSAEALDIVGSIRFGRATPRSGA